MTKRVLRVFLVAVSCSGITSCSGGSASANSPTSPSNTGKIEGGWVGTLTRPNGLPSIALRWDVGVFNSSSGDQLTGTMTLTGPGVSTTLMAVGNTAGNDKQGYSIYMSFRETTPPGSCKVVGATSAAGGGDRFPGPYTQIAVPAFKISYVADCRGLFDGATPQTFVEETVQLSLTRQ